MRTHLAKSLYWVGGLLSRIKTPQKVYRLSTELVTLKSDPNQPLKFEAAGRSWLPCRLSMKFLGWSLRVDPVHFDHWALVHDTCGGYHCMECKGRVCGAGTDD